LFASLKTSKGETCQPWKDNCSVDEYKCKVTCVEGGSPPICTKEADPGADANADCPEDTELTTIDDIASMDGNKCRDLCKTGKNCYYYRYEELPREASKTKVCYLMGMDQCGDFADGDCNQEFCQSGKGSDNDCQGGDDGVTDEIYSCNGPTPHTPDLMPNYMLHWSCIGSGREVDIETEVSVPGGTTCTAKPVCNKDLKYQCVPKGHPGDFHLFRDRAVCILAS